MGVPKFFRYTSERYPCLNELVKQHQIPDFDNMYLDMNGIIHNCSHPDDSNPHFRITEEKIFQDIFHYLSILFQIIKPKKLFFMAIDGVAPRAKMNQQRGRRFRSAREAEKLEEEARKKGEVLPSEKRFDSNCITPGTVFMARLHEQLKYFIKRKISTDPLWAKVKVILSGHETPGEGEHKIMDYIRYARSQPDYDPTTRHCLYGLDADLIMLGMCTHEPHFALLREEVKFGKNTARATSPEETNFFLLHLSLLREYLEQEFISIKDKLPFEYDIEKVVDDWVLMGFLVGNDFIPNLPNMHISNDALPVLYATYMTVLPTLDGYINESGELNLRRFEIFMQELAKLDKEKFQDTYADLKYFEAKTGRRPNANERKEYKPNNDDTFNVDVNDIKENVPDDELQALINATEDMFMDDLINDERDEDDLDTSDEEANFNMEFILHKKDYYMNKLDYSKVTQEVLSSQAEGYVRAIQWNLYYYYRGCPSWCWYYPHHYAPYISDIKDFADKKITFEPGEPFKPFEQLLAVLPAASKNLLPAPFHDLMTDEDSPIVHYYPINFDTDLNGKKNDWEAVVLIPFIDEVNLLSAMSPCYQRLTDEERKRNTHGPMMVYSWTAESQGTAIAPEYFPPIRDCHAIEKAVYRQELDVPLDQLKSGMLPNARRDLIFPGFPTMRHLKYKTTIKKCKVKVFDQPSRNENMIVQLINEPEVERPLETLARSLLGKVVWVGWPHLAKAKIVSVSNEKQRLHLLDINCKDGIPDFNTELNTGNVHKQWISERSTIIEHNMNRLGIELGDVTTIVHAVGLRGYKYIIQDNSRMVMDTEWCTVPCGYALQAIVDRVNSQSDVISQFSTPQDAYPTGEIVFLLTLGYYYAAKASVVDSTSIRSGRIKVQVSENAEPTVPPAPASAPYRPANHAAASCGISTQVLSRITGSIFVILGERHDMPTEQMNKINIGLNLKFNKKNQEVSGYTRRCPFTGAWLYSARCVELVASYVKQFPALFERLPRILGNDIFFEQDICPNEMGQKKIDEMHEWVKGQPHNLALRRECGSEALEPEEMKLVAEAVDTQLKELKLKEKTVTLHVKWSLLYKADLHEGSISPDPKADFRLYDRVVCVARNMTVPVGARGTITAIHRPSNMNTVRLSDKLNAEPTYQVMFDEPFPGALTEELFEEARFYRLQPCHMLNISYGRKLRTSSDSQPVDTSFLITQTPQTPHVLRRNDGHHSAFASYSPTKDRQTPVAEQRSTPQKVHNNSVSQENSTELLKSLLKISQDDPNTNTNKKVNKHSPNAEPAQNWRSKNDTIPQQQATPPQRPNWRAENAGSLNNNRAQTNVPNEWSNKNFNKGPMPIPPFPNFGAAHQVPAPAQIPFPQFQNALHQQPNRNHENYHRNQNNHFVKQNSHPGIGIANSHPGSANSHPGNPKSHSGIGFANSHPGIGIANSHPGSANNHPGSANNHPGNPNSHPGIGFANSPPGNPNSHPGNPYSHIGNQNNSFQKGHSTAPFPKHLPSINSSLTLAPPTWNKGQAQATAPNPEQNSSRPHTNSGSEKTTNPFVPLQVQTSQRRVQKPSGAVAKKEHSGDVLPQPQFVEPQFAVAQKSTPSKPQRKKKSRIAANLPFNIE